MTQDKARQYDEQAVRQRLEERRRELQQQIAENDNLDYDPGTNPDQTELAQDYPMQERDSGVQEINEQQLAQVEEALHRLDSGRYGICSNCGQPIAPERLEIMPEATLCVRCQETLASVQY
jgi:RNA polymerase-binding protein DksA